MAELPAEALKPPAEGPQFFRSLGLSPSSAVISEGDQRCKAPAKHEKPGGGGGGTEEGAHGGRRLSSPPQVSPTRCPITATRKRSAEDCF